LVYSKNNWEFRVRETSDAGGTGLTEEMATLSMKSTHLYTGQTRGKEWEGAEILIDKEIGFFAIKFQSERVNIKGCECSLSLLYCV